MPKLREKIENWANDYTLKRKLQVLYVFCILMPLFLTDGMILRNMMRSEQKRQQYEMQRVADAVSYHLSNRAEYAASMAKEIYLNREIERFLNTQFTSGLDFFVQKQEFLKDTLFESSIGIDGTRLTMYADNGTIINGGEFGRLSSVENTEWYRTFWDSGQDTRLLFSYDGAVPAGCAERKMLFLRKMDYFRKNESKKFVKIEIDYSSIVRDMEYMNYEMPVYLCKDGRTLLSNDGHNSMRRDFEEFDAAGRIGYQKEITLYGEVMQICVLKTPSGILSNLREHLGQILLLGMLNIIFPYFLMRLIDQSIAERIRELGQAFESVEEDRLVEIPHVRGRDEIGGLMLNYNRMVRRTNDLIQTVYKDKLREQEIDIARQNAELLALHSQINPHFLFNALESIRMHSLLKQEYETADMVERLTVMERQNVDWGTDQIEIKKEMEFVEAYLGLQKYRFGDKLSYELDVEPECALVKLPKLTIVTFVENACVHGIESKTSQGWIFVRVYREGDALCIEIEDTGGGMEEEKLEELRERVAHVSIDKLKEKGRVGVLNACLRLKMVTDGAAQVTIESEKDVGAMVQIRLPYDRLAGI